MVLTLQLTSKQNTKHTIHYKKNTESKHADQIKRLIEEQRRQIRFILGNIKCPQSELGTGLIEYHQRKQRGPEKERE